MRLFLGRREAVVVLVAVPATLALTLFSSYLFANAEPVTLFALIFAIGILVDDAIVVVETSTGTTSSGGRAAARDGLRRRRGRNPTILATFAVVAACCRSRSSRPDGPYMRRSGDASAAMVFSLLVAFVVSRG